MSKKRFTSGLDTLFEQTNEGHGQVSASRNVASLQNTEGDTHLVASKKIGSKNFTSDLDALFNEAFTEVVEEKIEKMRRESGLSANDPFGEQEKRFKASLSGLDALIRSTVDQSLAGLEHAPVKRLTIMFENQKIEKLKNIAKLEKAFVKDLVSGVLNEFIENYDKRKKGGTSFA